MFEIVQNINGQIVKKTVYGVRCKTPRSDALFTEFLFFVEGKWVWEPANECYPYMGKRWE